MSDEVVGWREDGSPFTATEFKRWLLDGWRVNDNTLKTMFGTGATKECLFDAVSRMIGDE